MILQFGRIARLMSIIIMITQEEAEKEQEELTPDEIGRKIASQWTTDPDAAGSSSESDTTKEEEGVENQQAGSAQQVNDSLAQHAASVTHR